MSKLFILFALCCSTLLYAGNTVDWPDLKNIKHIVGRHATVEDIDSGVAAFALQEDDNYVGRLIDMVIPQYAIHVDQDSGEKTNVIIIQAEEDDGIEILGAIAVENSEHLIALKYEFKLLGVKLPNESATTQR